VTDAVAVTGIGIVSPFGWGTDLFWNGLVAGRSALGPLTRFEATNGVGLVGEVPARAVGEVARSAVGRRMDWTSLMALGACRLALDDAGLARDGLAAERTSLALGSAYGNLQETATFLDRLFARGSGNPLLFPNMVFNAPLAYCSIELGIRGETTMLSMLEVSGEAAVAWGVDAVAARRADVCLAGGVDELGQVLHRVLEDGGRLTPSSPRPFASDADGIAAGEGAGILVLERVTDARARGARVYAIVAAPPGFSVPAPVHGWPVDSEQLGEGLSSRLRDADAVLASASGDADHDGVEATALARATRAPVTATRGATGHFGAAGALAAGAAALAVSSGIVPPAAGVAAGSVDLDLVGTARRAAIGTAAVVGMARGGIVRVLRLTAA
jgi:3-oxoacyl-[acyl-carrier-protein] synthase II